MNRATALHPLIADYLRDLDRAARALPRRERRELVAEIEAHLDEALAGTDGSEAAVRNLIEELGEPDAIVSSAGPLERPAGRGLQEIAAVILLLIGGIVLPIFGWVIGVVLLWSSRAWTVMEKVLGTVIVPGGLAASLPLVVLGLRMDVAVSWFALGMLVLLTVAPITMAAYLLWSAGRPRA